MTHHMNQTKSRHNTTPQTTGEATRHEPALCVPATHDVIARHAYDIYNKSGRRQGRCQQNWAQAERELAAAAARDVEPRPQAASTTFQGIGALTGGPGVLRSFTGDGGIAREGTPLASIAPRHGGI